MQEDLIKLKEELKYYFKTNPEDIYDYDFTNKVRKYIELYLNTYNIEHKYFIFEPKKTDVHNHYLDHIFNIRYINNYNFKIYINELFGNCSTVMLNNCILFKAYNDLNLKILMLIEDICDIYGYTCILYTISKSNIYNIIMLPIFEDLKYNVISEYINKRGGAKIEIYQKLI